MHEILRHSGYIISVVLSQIHLRLICNSTQEWILLHHVQIILNCLNTVDSLHFDDLPTEILRNKLMAEANTNKFEFFIELICLKDVA